MKSYKIRLNKITNKKKDFIENQIFAYNELKEYFIGNYWRIDGWDKRNYLRDKLINIEIKNKYHSHHWQQALGEVISLMKNKNIKEKPIIKNRNAMTFTNFNCKIKYFDDKKLSKYWLKLSFKYNGKSKILLIPLTSKFNLENLQGYYKIKIEEGHLYFICYQKTLNKKIVDNEYDAVQSIDIGYNDLFYCNNKVVGRNFKSIIDKISFEYQDKIVRRSKLNSLKLKYKKQGNHKKYQNIIRFNLGKNKWNKQVKIYKEQLKTYIYTKTKELFSIGFKILIMEFLNFKKRKLPKSVNKRLNFWFIGIIKKAIEKNLKVNGVYRQYINPKYTSTACYQCGYNHKDNRNLKHFKCLKCGNEDDSDNNAVKNIERRGLKLLEPKLQILFNSQSESELFKKLRYV